MIVPDRIDRIAPTRRPEGRPVMYQAWREILFLHWEVEPDPLRGLLPNGLELDLFDGRAFVGLVPFTMTGIHPRGLPTFGPLSNFHETNVRTYVHVGGENPGVWFFSLDAANPVAVAIARVWFLLPYHFARMSLSVSGVDSDERALSYESRRIGRGHGASASIRASASGPIATAEPGTLEHFLLERYVLYASSGSGLRLGRVHHSPYAYRPARVERLEETLLAAAGIARPLAPPISALYSEGVTVDVFGLERVRSPR